MPALFDPITLRSLTVRNRVWLAPMCQYSCEGGVPNDWHLVHLGARATGGFGLLLTEAAAVSPEGRISPQDAGIWSDEQAQQWERVVGFVHSQGAAIGIQLAHAGRKGSTYRPWAPQRGTVPASDGGWVPVGPSDEPYPGYDAPQQLDVEGIAAVVRDVRDAAVRSVDAGFDAVELHAAHGYLFHEFLSPLSNHREDAWGGSFEGRTRLLLDTVDAVRGAIPDGMPLLVRISGTDWLDGGWDLEQSVELARLMAPRGVDLVDVSSGGNAPASIPVGPGYQVPLSAGVRAGAGVATGAVGLITDPVQAEKVLANGEADVVLLARAALREPAWPLRAAHELGRRRRRRPLAPAVHPRHLAHRLLRRRRRVTPPPPPRNTPHVAGNGHHRAVRSQQHVGCCAVRHAGPSAVGGCRAWPRATTTRPRGRRRARRHRGPLGRGRPADARRRPGRHGRRLRGRRAPARGRCPRPARRGDAARGNRVEPAVRRSVDSTLVSETPVPPPSRGAGDPDGRSGRPRRPRGRGRGRPRGDLDPAERAAHRAQRLEHRRGLVPAIRYPEDLPVSSRRDDIAEAIRDHQVVVVAGETGSGKTTQLPKILLELGRGVEGTIGHTQPRRIAARAVAERLADELDVELGGVVGYQVRFADHSSRDTLVKVMTDGILLAELQHDRDLRRYDTIVIDEAHERSLNIDFILGYLKQLLPRRPDLKVVITSATIDPQRFADHFSQPGKPPVPVVEVSGRTYPVEVRYRPLVADEPSAGDDDEDGARVGAGDGPGTEDRDQTTGIVDAVTELWTERRDGDILVFLSGEREIRDAADALAGLDLPQTEVLPLFGRLSAAEQHRVFGRRPPGVTRRVVLATNVAETSLTVPGIRYVVDTGTARISRWSARTKVQRLPIEPVSRASADQRKGRCGRVAEGICIRLYSEDDYLSRPEFTDPEILRTNLASVILQMTSLGLGDVAAYPFLDPPDPRAVTDGVRLLEELRAVEPEDANSRPSEGGSAARSRRLTPYGRTIAALPVDPRLARMVIEADARGCLREVLVVVSALSLQDVRERPLEKRELADAAHKRFAVEGSDFGAYLMLWRYLREQQKALSSSAFRRLCKAEYLHFLRVREWQDLHAQLRQACKQAGYDTARGTSEDDAEPDLEAVHRSLLTGLLSQIGSRDEVRRDYLGARGLHFSIAPGSVVFRKQPAFVMAGELVETNRTWARGCARIDPLWAEEAGEHLVKRTYSEPTWSARRGSAVATERVTLYGVPIVTGRTVGYAAVDAEEARTLFVQRALVEGEWTTRHRFFHDNAELVERLRELEARTRRRDIVVDDETVRAFYDERIPAEVVSARHFDTWWKKASRREPRLLHFTEDLLVRDSAEAVDRDAYPTTWRQGDLRLPVTYRFEPGRDDDGVTVHVPVDVLNQVTADGFDWQVPGVREDLVTALIRTLPKVTRRLLVPAPEHAAATVRVLAERGLGPADGPLTTVLSRVLRETHGVVVQEGDWDLERVPTHLRVRFSIEDPGGRVIAVGQDLDALREQAAPQLRRQVARAGADLQRTGLTSWTVGEVPVEVTTQGGGGRTVHGYPALVDEGTSVALRVLPTRAEAQAEHRVGVRRLLVLGTSAPWKQVLARLTNTQKLALGHNPHGSVPALLQDCLECAVDALAAEHVPHEVRTEADFDAALKAVRTHAAARVLQVVGLVEPVLARHLQAVTTLERMTQPALRDTVADVRSQLAELVRPGFVAETGFARLPDLGRYLQGVLLRLERAPVDPLRDGRAMDEVLLAEQAYGDLLERLRPAQRASEPVVAVGWMIEELRVSLFANRLGTAAPVSVKRIQRAIAAVPTD